nr:hypothetical protein [Nitrosomonas nitrosa]
MSRARLIPPDFWTSEAVVDCAPMTRLLLLGLANFADDFGVLPLRPRTVRLQVFPGDALDDDQVRAMLDALVARGLLRRYAVDGVDYLAILDWAVHQRVGRRARRRYPADPASAGHDGAAGEGPAASSFPLDHSKAQQSPAPDLRAPPPSEASASPDPRGETPDAAASDAAWLNAVETTLRRVWGGDLPADVARHVLRWRAEGRDLARDVVPAIRRSGGSRASPPSAAGRCAWSRWTPSCRRLPPPSCPPPRRLLWRRPRETIAKHRIPP